MSTLRVNTLQNTSTTDGGISINNSGHVTVDGVAMPSAGPLSNRNLIINGAMQVAQRGDTETGVNNTRYSGPDRWRVVVAAGTYTVSRSTTAPEGFSNSWKLDCTTSGTLGASDLMLFHQRIEGQNVQHLKYGTANAEQLTASFWIRSTKTGTVTVEFYQPNDLRQISKTVTIDTANTWEYKTVTIPGDTTGVIDDTTNRGLELLFWLGAGSDYTSGTLNTTGWAGVTTANRVSSSNIDISDSTSNDIYITGVQLEVGSVATPFEHRSFGDELRRCQRYYWQTPTGVTSNFAFSGFCNTTTNSLILTRNPVPMRAAPSFTSVGSWTIIDGAGFSVSSFTFQEATALTGRLDCTCSGLTVSRPNILRTASTTSTLQFNAEL